MKKLLLLVVLLGVCTAQTQIKFSDYFENKTLRIDYYRIGGAKGETTVIDKVLKYGEWYGNPDQVISPFQMGRNRIKLYDLTTNQLIYSRGYDNYFGEYQVSSIALAGKDRAYFETALVPLPKRPVMFVLETRDKEYIYHVKFQTKINPKDYHINSETRKRNDLIVKEIENGDPHKKVDLVFVGEGYTVNDEKKFRSDLTKFTNILFTQEPYKSRKDDFNVYGVMSPSSENGVDEPRKGIYKNTVLNCTFNSLDSERYLLTENVETLYDIVSQVPCDAIAIMCNIDRYGGGGIYNFYATFTASNKKEDYVFVHEFGHSFAGLADEYYTSDVAYTDFYPKGIEPAEPNITALLDKDHLKWKDLMSPGLSIPTEWGKETFDSLNTTIGKLYKERAEKLKSAKTESEKKKIISETRERVRATHAALDKFLKEHPLRGKVGVFEGAGYSSKGLYRPTLNSIMHKFTKEDKSYYPVSAKAINDMIDFYTK